MIRGPGVLLALAAGVLASCRGPSVPSVPPDLDEREPAPVVTGAPSRDLPMPSGELGHGSLFGDDEGDTVLAKLGDLEIHKRHVLDRMLEIDPQRVREALETLLLDVRVRRLANELGVTVPETDLRLAVRRDWGRVERMFARQPAGAADVDAYVEGNWGMKPPEFRARLRLLAWRRLLRAYTLRYRARIRGALRLEFFAHPSREVAASVREQIAIGADFKQLARTRSAGRSAGSGGQLPDLPPGFDHPAVRLAKGLEVGELSALSRVERGDRALWVFARLAERRAPDPRPFASQVAEIRSDLEARPVGAAELAVFVTGQ